jgi:hypothetical protein
VHFDIHTDDLDAEIKRLLALGATMVDDSFTQHPGRWVIMRDPSGVNLCVVAATNKLRGQKLGETSTAGPNPSTDAPPELLDDGNTADHKCA